MLYSKRLQDFRYYCQLGLAPCSGKFKLAMDEVEPIYTQAKNLVRSLKVIAWLLPHLEMVRPSLKNDCLLVRKLVLRRRLDLPPADRWDENRGRPYDPNFIIYHEKKKKTMDAWNRAWFEDEL